MFKIRPKENKTIEPASSGESMQQFVDWLKNYSTLNPQIVFEIGANLAQDAAYIKEAFGIKDRNVWVFEPHPDLYKHIKKTYKFKAFDLAISNKNTSIKFNAINLDKNTNSGISSMRKHNYVSEDDFKVLTVQAIRMDTFLEKYKNLKIDFLKLDVEGCNSEVLEGFGERINDVNSIHIESEHEESWQGEKLWPDISTFLSMHGFEMVYMQRYYSQSDSFWVRSRYLKPEPR